MNIVATICKEIVGLFVDDGSLALALLLWLALLMLIAFLLPPASIGVLLFLGCAAILAENVLRRARRR